MYYACMYKNQIHIWVLKRHVFARHGSRRTATISYSNESGVADSRISLMAEPWTGDQGVACQDFSTLNSTN